MEGGSMLCDSRQTPFLSYKTDPSNGAERWGITWRMGGLEDPVGILCVCDQFIVPFDLEVAGCLLEERWTRKVVDVELGGHCRYQHSSLRHD